METITSLYYGWSPKYRFAFKTFGLAIFGILEVFIDPKKNTSLYLERLLSHACVVVGVILETNLIETDIKSSLTANLMIERPANLKQGRMLDLVAFGPLRSDRKFIKLNLPNSANKKYPPGAQTAFMDSKPQYIDDITKKEYGSIFSSKEYKCFYSIPLCTEDCTGNNFAVLKQEGKNVSEHSVLRNCG